MLKMTFYGLTDVGCVRDSNQDSFLMHEKGGLFVVADGMGGHAGGEVASSLAVRAVYEVLSRIEDHDNPIYSFHAGGVSAEALVFERLRHSVNMASQSIQTEAMRNPACRGMGTTIAILLIEGDCAYVGHAGDSRVYLVSVDGIRRLTRDHTWVADQMRAGLITEAQAATSQYRNLLTRSVGIEPRVNIDTFARRIESGDRYLLCSDGLHGVISDAEIYRIVLNHSPRVSVEKLILLARERGGPDNITCLVVAFDEDDPRRRRRRLPFDPEI